MAFSFFTGQNTVKIFFEYNNEVIQLPVNPDEISIQKNGKNEVVEVVQLGEVNILKDPALSTFSIDSYFPFYDDTSGVLTHGKDFKTPEELTNFFNKPFNKKEPLRMIITGLWASENEKRKQQANTEKVEEDILPQKGKAIVLSIENFETRYVGGDKDTLYKIEFKQYKNFGAKKYKSDFKVPEYNGKFKVVATGIKRVQNIYKDVRKKTKDAENAVKATLRYASGASQSLNTIRTTGSIIGTNIK